MTNSEWRVGNTILPPFRHPPLTNLGHAMATRLFSSGFPVPRLPLMVPPSDSMETLPMFFKLAFAGALALSAGSALAQQPAAPAPAAVPAAPMPAYGPVITLDQAKRAMAAAELEAAKNSWQVAITILDSGGNTVMFHKLDNAQLSAATVSEGKARTALEFKRPSKALDDAIAGGGAGKS